MKSIPLFLLGLLPFSLFSQPANTSWLQGTWSGIGYQIDGNEWSVLLIVEDDAFTISYPSLACGGTWSLIEIRDASASGTETILEGISNCDNHVEVQLRLLDPDRMLVEYYIRWYSPEKPIAFAVLRRVGLET